MRLVVVTHADGPSSVTGGRGYVIARDAPIADLPGWALASAEARWPGLRLTFPLRQLLPLLMRPEKPAQLMGDGHGLVDR
jgi:hypothetical protein